MWAFLAEHSVGCSTPVDAETWLSTGRRMEPTLVAILTKVASAKGPHWPEIPPKVEDVNRQSRVGFDSKTEGHRTAYYHRHRNSG